LPVMRSSVPPLSRSAGRVCGNVPSAAVEARRPHCTPEPFARETRAVQAEGEVREVVNRETRAWDTQDVELLLSVFHPDMVWPWPLTYTSLDPVDWRLEMGRFDAARWRRRYEDLFSRYELVHNRRSAVKIEVPIEG